MRAGWNNYVSLSLSLTIVVLRIIFILIVALHRSNTLMMATNNCGIHTFLALGNQMFMAVCPCTLHSRKLSSRYKHVSLFFCWTPPATSTASDLMRSDVLPKKGTMTVQDTIRGHDHSGRPWQNSENIAQVLETITNTFGHVVGRHGGSPLCWMLSP